MRELRLLVNVFWLPHQVINQFAQQYQQELDERALAEDARGNYKKSSKLK